jgi:hypothetical protein
MGAGGTAAAMETADLALMDSSLLKVVQAQQLGARCLAKIKQNVLFSIVSKVVMIVLTVGGLTTLWIAVLADVGCMLIVCLNGMRLLEKPTAAGQQRPQDDCAPLPGGSSGGGAADGRCADGCCDDGTHAHGHGTTAAAVAAAHGHSVSSVSISCVLSLSSRGLVRRVTYVLLLRGVIAIIAGHAHAHGVGCGGGDDCCDGGDDACTHGHGHGHGATTQP